MTASRPTDYLYVPIDEPLTLSPGDEIRVDHHDGTMTRIVFGRVPRSGEGTVIEATKQSC